MRILIYLVGWPTTVLLFIYGLLYLLYRKIKLKHDTNTPPIIMPVLRPIPIPTKQQDSFIKKLVAFVFEVRRWKLEENWPYKLNENEELIIPKGFTFDGASIPRIFWAILSPVGLLLIPGLIHDYGYRYDQIWKVGPDGCAEDYKKGEGKECWDRLFKQVGKQVNGVWIVNCIAWLAIAFGGKQTWEQHKAKREEGLKSHIPDRPLLQECNQLEDDEKPNIDDGPEKSCKPPGVKSAVDLSVKEPNK